MATSNQITNDVVESGQVNNSGSNSINNNHSNYTSSNISRPANFRDNYRNLYKNYTNSGKKIYFYCNKISLIILSRK